MQQAEQLSMVGRRSIEIAHVILDDIHLKGQKQSWAREHVREWNYGVGYPKAFHDQILGWAHYADAYEAEQGSVIGTDHILGPVWKMQGRALRALLNGNLGGLDHGTLDKMILEVAKVNGVELE